MMRNGLCRPTEDRILGGLFLLIFAAGIEGEQGDKISRRAKENLLLRGREMLINHRACMKH